MPTEHQHLVAPWAVCQSDGNHKMTPPCFIVSMYASKWADPVRVIPQNVSREVVALDQALV